MEAKKLEKATFAAGCFWGVEEAFRRVSGVAETEAGYAGGFTKNPTYEEVSSGKTGHAESVRIKYDPDEVSYQKLLDIFWSIHNPARSGVASNYRSIIFYHTPEQKRLALEEREALNRSGKYESPMVTEIIPAGKFWRAEEYHQKYYAKGKGGVCSA
ncbi:MAG: peptide-methionine (S)-S-oxide reductase MsrA [Candidatus Pacebacteria bacterium]|nr:peptide-methionine (S)-S-oxide reductase MsrA [Candidatus Paceibacterota bacterium]